MDEIHKHHAIDTAQFKTNRDESLCFCLLGFPSLSISKKLEGENIQHPRSLFSGLQRPHFSLTWRDMTKKKWFQSKSMKEFQVNENEWMSPRSGIGASLNHGNFTEMVKVAGGALEKVCNSRLKYHWWEKSCSTTRCPDPLLSLSNIHQYPSFAGYHSRYLYSPNP